jgi:hypothetical protein
MTNKIQQTNEDLQNHLAEQLHFMEISAENFDNGDHSEAKRLAVSIRVLLHDTDSSHSLLRQLGIKDGAKFFDTSSTRDIVGTYAGLVLKAVGPNGGSYVAPLDDVPPSQVFEQVDFEAYWNKPIVVDTRNQNFSRKNLILSVANQDGGAHIDPGLNKDYATLTRENTLGWVYNTADETGPLTGEALASVRQIAHEVLKSLIPNYPEKKLLNTQNSIILGDIFLANGLQAGRLIGLNSDEVVKELKAIRNQPCNCGSSKLYKDCGYLKTEEHKNLSKGEI